ncbi:N-acetylglucosamine-1-phosphotransferase subunits alpha/beta isoform X3 [Cryptotermes secundus]|nr:N-acetylglucosamine-1-phosphotransferase subunits alpha/beta isoform X3 [Cryptotermes secundus]
MTWSQEKYETVFNSFSDNIVGKSLQSKLCQNVPIDVVYTWVNGSDPILLQQLQQYHLQLQKESSIKCPYANCAPSHILTFRDQLLDEAVEDALLLAGFQGKNASLRHRVTVENNNWTFIEFYSPELAAEAMKFMLKSNVTICHAHWTSDSTVSKTSGDAANTVMISGIPNTLIKEAGNSVHTELARHLQSKIQNMWVYAEKGLAVVEVESSESVSRILQLLSNVTIGGNIVNISKAYLILEIPLVYNSKDFSPSRFEDKEELRYSLRSLERFAPWVRHVYLVTNGQIPYWLDMENPRLTVVTHDQIFPDPSHLPTFSSPAIESHIHRIPGLSRKFLYLNDDVMFGKEVWPDDFITNTNGQKVYLSWPVPDCSDSCPWSWVADGSCDVSCNISECSFDGGDCDLSAEDDIGLYDENRHLANYDDNVNLYNENHHESINDNLFHNINFGGDVVLEDLQDPGKKMNSLLDVLIKTNAKKDSFKGNLPFLREFDEIKYKNSNGSRNISDTDNTPPFIYKHNITSKFLLYREIKLDSKKTANQHRKNNNPQQYEEIYGGEGNNTLCMQRIPQVQEGKKENTSSDNTFIVRGSALVHQQKHSWYVGDNLLINTRTGNNDNRTNTEHSTQSYVDKLSGNSSASVHHYHVDNADVPGELYLRHTNQNASYVKETELKRNYSDRFVAWEKWQNVQSSAFGKKNVNHSLLYSNETFHEKPNEGQHIHSAKKSNQTYGTGKSFSSQTVKREPVRDVSAYNARLRKLYLKLNGKSDELQPLYAKHNPPSADVNRMHAELQHIDYDVDWKNGDKVSNIPKKKRKVVKMFDAQQYHISPPGKKPHDTFAESLLYVNRLYNQEFGFEPRKVPAHMPHLIDIDIMESLQARFSKQWHLTSSHKVRHPHDMQFAFSYFYFLMSSKVTLPLSDIFDIFDTDDSGTWSDREIRTLLTRSYDLPLNYARVVKFENDIVNCSKELSEELSNVNVPTPPYERYQDSNLPVVSKTLVSNCKPVVDMLVKKFGDRKMYRYQVERDKHQDVSFKMLSSNITQLVSHLDDVRRDPKKFICLNDNLDPKREEDNAVARAILHDMYESLFPQPSSFELPPEFRNRFLHMTELEAWRTNKNTIRTVVYICLTILITFTLVNFFHVECRWLQRKLCQRMRQQYHRETPLVPCV